jgi:hypothetical protein
MIKILPIIALLLTAATCLSSELTARSDRNKKDGTDRRVVQVQQYLSRIIPKKELEMISFKEAAVHIKDSLSFYMKLPYKDKNLPGFLLVKYERGAFQHVKIAIEGYRYNDKRLRNRAREVVISSKNKKLNKKFIMNSSGRVEKMIYPKPKIGNRDTGFSITPFLSYGSINPNRPDSINLVITFDQFEAYIDTNFIFDYIDNLNNDRLHTKVLVHDMIPLVFIAQPSFTLEYSNIDILPAIDIKKIFNSNSRKVDSIPKF